jgi:flagellar hook-basal body complex protein FliE
MISVEVGAINAVLSQMQVAEIGAAQKPQSLGGMPPNGSTFASYITEGVEKVNTALVRADAVLSQAAIDGTQPPHQVILAMEEARLTFHLALQVRNRLLEGYQELMRMQV